MCEYFSKKNFAHYTSPILLSTVIIQMSQAMYTLFVSGVLGFSWNFMWEYFSKKNLCTLHIFHPVVHSNYPDVLGYVHTFCIRRPWIFMKFHVRVFFEKKPLHTTHLLSCCPQ